MFGGLIKIVVGAGFFAMVAGIYLSDPRNSQSAAHMADGLVTRGPSAAPVRAPPPVAAPVQRIGYGREEIAADSVGQYHATVEFEGNSIPMLVDTGATLVALTYADADKLGYAPAPADYTVPVQTANGLAKAASLKLREVRLGTLMVSDVPALVMPREITGVSLLGMSFLKKLGGFEIASGKLVMRQ